MPRKPTIINGKTRSQKNQKNVSKYQQTRHGRATIKQRRDRLRGLQ